MWKGNQDKRYQKKKKNGNGNGFPSIRHHSKDYNQDDVEDLREWESLMKKINKWKIIIQGDQVN